MRWLGPLVLGMVVGCGSRSGIAIDPVAVESVEVRVAPPEVGGERPVPIRSKEPAAIREFLGSLRRARETEDHKCADWAHVTISRRQGAPLEIGLLPGHDADYYEYRYADGIYRTPRGPMVGALKHLGVASVPLGP